MSGENRAADDAGKALAQYRAEGVAELAAMQAAFQTLASLPYGARNRALRWLEARLDNRAYEEEPPF